MGLVACPLVAFSPDVLRNDLSWPPLAQEPDQIRHVLRLEHFFKPVGHERAAGGAGRTAARRAWSGGLPRLRRAPRVAGSSSAAGISSRATASISRSASGTVLASEPSRTRLVASV